MTDPSDPHKDLAGVLHDVSNALTVLLGWVGEAKAEGATEEQRVYALGIIEQRARIARDLARHAIGAPRIDEQRDAGAIVEEITEALRVEAARLGVVLVVRGKDLAVKLAGALDVSQVVTNIVLNAFAHAPPGSRVEVSVTLEGDRVVFFVTDEGPGISVNRRETVFKGDTERPGGTGVGLRHARALARAWGGDVELVDHDSRGARFRVMWPHAHAIPRPPVSAPRGSDLVDKRILIIEDDPAVFQLLEAVLGARGATVTLVTKGEELGPALAEGPFDAALVDLSPIAADPTGALAKIRASYPKATIALMTGQADALPEVVDAESLRLVRKPFELAEVLAAIKPRK